MLRDLDAQLANVTRRSQVVSAELRRIAGVAKQPAREGIPGSSGLPGEIDAVREEIADAQRAAARQGKAADTARLDRQLAQLESHVDELRRERAALGKEQTQIASERAQALIDRHEEFVAYADQVAADGVPLLEAVLDAQAKVEQHRPLVSAAVELAVAGIARRVDDEPGPDSVVRQRLAQWEVELRRRYEPWTGELTR